MQTARVTSIEALRTFKAALQQFMLQADRAMVEADLELQRIDDWVRSEKPAYWAEQVRKRHDATERAKDEVRKAQFTIDGRPPSAAEQKKALKVAQARLDEAKCKLETTRRWRPRIEQAGNEYKAQIGHLASAIQGDLPRALTTIDRAIESLESYTAVAAPQLDSDLREEVEAAAAASHSAGSTVPIDPFDGWPLDACRALRRLTLPAAERAGVEAAAPEQFAAADSRDQTSELIIFRDRASLPRIKPQREARIIIDPRALAAPRIYLERVHVSDDDQIDSGWHVGVVERRERSIGPAGADLCAITISGLNRLRPQWREILSLPHGHLAVLEQGVLCRLLDSDDQDPFDQDEKNESVADENE